GEGMSFFSGMRLGPVRIMESAEAPLCCSQRAVRKSRSRAGIRLHLRKQRNSACRQAQNQKIFTL
ncbi:hypothetical protein PENTCL1PPCAC_3853, partial [Pristionchus entomophagus]